MPYDLGVIKRQRREPPSITTGTYGSSFVGFYSTGSSYYAVHLFTSSGPFTLPSFVTTTTAQLLVVGGGGGGGGPAVSGGVGGGGGGGGVINSSTFSITTTSFVIQIGAGGATNVVGQSSTVTNGLTVLTALGGGPGGAPLNGSGGNGSSGGGGSGSGTGGTGISGQGFAGGAGGSQTTYGGAGGGSGGVGDTANSGAAGRGGTGTITRITGVPLYFGGGGGGGANAAGYANGSLTGGGGAGGTTTSPAGASGSSYSGGGGGGGGSTTGVGGAGGSGIVILSYAIPKNLYPDNQSDPYFRNNALLLNATTGTSGNSSLLTYNIFTDFSGNGLAMANDGVTAATLNPFDPGFYHSIYFNGSSYLTIGANTNFNFIHSTAAIVTVEFWAYPTLLTSNPFIFSTNAGNANYVGGSVQITSSGNIAFTVASGGGNFIVQATSAGTIISNVWSHIAVTWNYTGNTGAFYINGNPSGTFVRGFGVGVTSNSTFALTIGQSGSSGNFYNGYISNLRLVNGTVVYSGLFVIPREPLSTIQFAPSINVATITSGTSALVGRFATTSTSITDYSTLTNSITNVGVSASTLNPFTSTLNESVYFNGTGKYLSLTKASGSWLASNYTMEAWIYLNATGTMTIACELGGPGSGTIYSWNWVVSTSGIGVSYQYLNLGNGGAGASIPLSLFTWYHVALTGSGVTATLFVNGSQVGSGNSGPWTARGTLQIGLFGSVASGSSVQYRFNGYISNFRIVNGVVVYTGNFTPPTSSLQSTQVANPYGGNNTSAITTGTSLLTLKYSTYGLAPSNFVDYGAYNLGAVSSNFPGQGTFSPFGNNWSTYFNGLTDYLVVPDIPAFTVGSNDWTIETWAYLTANTGTAYIAGQFNTNNVAPFGISLSSTNKPTLTLANTTATNSVAITSAIAISTGTWSHLAFVRSGLKFSVYVNGQEQAFTYGSAYSDSSINSAVAVPSNLTYSSLDPYDQSQYHSLYFNGSSYLNLPANAGFNFGTGDFTWESWVYPITYGSGPGGMIIDFWNGLVGAYTIGSCQFWINNSGVVYFQWATSVSLVSTITTTATIPLNAWAHLAVVRLAGNITIYINGIGNTPTAAASAIGSNTLVGSIGRWTSGNGYFFNGYISNVRIVKGLALYSGSLFVVPTSPLSNIQNAALTAASANFTNTTQLLTGRFVNPSRYFFDDYSSNNFVVTNTGVAAANLYPPISSTSTFNSMYFRGTSTSFLSIPANSAWTFGTGDFTVEAWVYWPSTVPFDGAQHAIVGNIIPFNNASWELQYIGNYWRLASWDTWAVNGWGGPSTIVGNTWYHIAATRSGTTGKIWLNGNDVTTSTQAFPLGSTNLSSNNPLIIGISGVYATWPAEPWTGYISNLRIIKGTAIYTSNFTVPSSQLTTTQLANQNGNNTPAITAGTSLLIGRSSPIVSEGGIAVDYSVIPNYITSVGNTFATNLAPPISSSGWSNYTSGGNNLDLTVSGTAMNPSTVRTFTIECWINPSSTNIAYATIISKGTTTNRDWAIYINAATSTARDVSFYYSPSSGDYSVTSSAGVINFDTWQHVAVVSNSSAITFYVNGVQVGSGTQSQFNSSNPSAVHIGRFMDYTGVNSQPFIGNISNLRYVSGLALYTSTFTPPTAPLTAITNTSLLTCQSNIFVDNSTNAFALTVNGTPSIQPFSPFPTTSDPTVWGGSMYFNGTSQSLTVPSNAAFGYASGTDFTIEMWIYVTAINGAANMLLIDGRLASTEGLYPTLYITQTTGTIAYYTNSVIRITGSALSINTWYHVALVRLSGSTKLYLNGTQTGSTYTDANTYVASAQQIAASYSGGAALTSFFNGYISSLRIVKGLAVYTGAFTRPSQPLTITQTANPYGGSNVQAISTGTYTSLLTLLPYTTNIVDYSTNTSAITIGSGTVSLSTLNPFTTILRSLYFNGNSSLSATSSTGWLTYGDHTVEAWVNLNTLTYSSMLIAGTYDGVGTTGWEWSINNYYMTLGYRSSGAVTTFVSTSFTSSPSPSLAQLLTDQGGIGFTPTNNGTTLNPSNYYGSSGSLSFNGTSNYVSVANNAAFAFGSGDLTVECWFYQTSFGATSLTLLALYHAAPGRAWILYTTTGGAVAVTLNASGLSGGTISLNTWNHVAWTRNGANFYLYLNGIQVATVAASTIIASTDPLFIGANNDASSPTWFFPGYINNIRIVKGLAVYTGTFTPPISLSISTQFGGVNTQAVLTASYISLLLGVSSLPTQLFTLNTWNHVAFSRLGTTASMYVNGVRTSSTIITSYTEQNTLRLGYMGFSTATSTYLTGYISNFRIVSGVAVYTGTNFVPPTGVLTTQQPTNPWSGTNTNAITFNTSTRFLTAIPPSQIITPYNSTASMLIGTAGSAITSMYPGYLSNFRMVNGTALYTGNFTPSSSPLARIDNTSLLIAANNNHVDDSVYNQYITTGTLNSSPTITKFTPYKIPGEYNKSMVGGSVYFSTSTAGSQNLNFGTAATSALGSGDFTVECWIYPTLYNSSGGIILDWRTNGGATANVPVLYLAANGTLRFQATGGTDLITSTRSVFLNTWNHISLVRNGSTIAMYINGYMVGIAYPNTTAFIIQTLFLNSPVTASNQTFYGYISSVRILVGRSIYNNATTTVPTTALTTSSNTQLITLQNNLIDNSTNSNFVRLLTANVTTATVVAPYTPFGGSGSAYFNSQYNYLTLPSSNSFAFGTGDFTMEAWIYPTTRNTVYGSVIVGPISYLVTTDWVWMIYPSGLLYFQIGAGTGLFSTAAVPLNQWSHVACVRYNALTTFYINGQINGSGTPAGATLTPVIVSAAGALSITSGNNVSATNGEFAVGLGDFTVECWVYLNSTGSDANYASFLASVSSAASGFAITRDAGGGLIPANGSGPNTLVPWLSTFVTDTWTHVALSNQSGTVRLFRNGILQGSASNSNNISLSTTIIALGRRYTDTASYPFVGYITGVRFVAGTALYTSSFNPLTSSNILDATSNVSGTKLLLLVNSDANKIVDTTGLSTMSNTGATYYNASLPSFINYTISGSGNTINNTIKVAIGSDINGNAATTFNGYISNLHLVKGTAKYITSFTPPMSDISTITNTVLLTLLSTETTFIDRSINSFAITNSTTATSFQAFSPFNTNYSTYFDGSSFVGAANFDGFNFSTSTEWTVEAWVNPNGNYANNNVLFAKRNAGSFNALSFNGTNQYLAVVNSTAFKFGTGDFTIECWVNYIAGGTNNGVWHLAATTLPATISGLALASITSGWRIYYGTAGTYLDLAVSPMSTNNWNHVALVRSSTVLTLYVNGVGYVVATNDTTNYNYTTNLAIGGYYSTTYLMNGYIANFRIVNGTAVYSGNFTVPNESLTITQSSNPFGGFNTNAITTGTVLIIGQFDGLSNIIVDRSYTAGTLISNFNIVAGTTLGPIFNASVKFDGSSQYLTALPTSSLNFGQSDFTVEAWVYPTVAQSTDNLIISASGIGGSLSFNGTSQYLKIANSVSFFNAFGNLGTGSKTIEFWTYYIASGAGDVGYTYDKYNIFGNWVASAVNGRFALGINNYDKFSFTYTTSVSAASVVYTTASVPKGIWTHIAFVCVGTTAITIYINGVGETLTVDLSSHVGAIAVVNDTSVWYNIGGQNQSGTAGSYTGYYNGYITNFRVVNGQAVYTSNFIVPTTPLGLTQSTNSSTNVASNTTILLLNVASSATYITDTSTSSFTITNTTTVLYSTNSPYSGGINGVGFFMGYSSTANSWGWGGSGSGWDYAVGAGRLNNVWQHLAVSRSGTNMRMFVNGIQAGLTQVNSSTYDLSIGNTYIGGQKTGYKFAGYISNVRAMNGVALYTSNFTVPTAPLTKYRQVALPASGSINFNNSPISLSTSSVQALGSNNFTIEFWMNSTSTSNSKIMGNGTGTTYTASTNSWMITFNGSNEQNLTGSLSFNSKNNTGTDLISTATNLNDGSWHHMAIVRSSSTFNLYVDGTLSSTTNNISTIDGGVAETLNIGASGFYGNTNYKGYLSNLRIVRGQAIYTGNFTAPSQMLQTTQNSGTNILAITTASNVSLLTAQYNLIADYSTRALPINVNTATVSTTINPTLFYPTYSAAFNITTSSQYLQISTSSFSFSTGTNFTVEAWVYLSGYSTTASVLFGTATPLSPNYVPVASSTYSHTSSSTPNWGWEDSGTDYSLMSAGGTGTWQFGAFTIGIQSSSGGARTTALLEDKNYYLEIAITATTGNKGIVIGLARASVSGSANYSGIYLYDGNIYINDNLQPGALGAYVIGDVINVAYNPTTNKQWIGKNGVWHTLGGYPGLPASTGISGGSLYFNGTNQYLTTAYSTALFDWYTSGVDYTIECWIYPTTYTGWYSATTNSPPTTVGNMAFNAATNYWSFGIGSATGQIRFYYYEGTAGGQSVVSTNTVPLNYWSHIAMTKTSGGITLFVNGVAQTTTAIIGTPQSSVSYALTMGAYNTYYQNGYVTNLRIVKGVAVYVGNFTIPTSALNTTQSGALTNTSGSLSFAGGANSIILPVDSRLAVGTSDFTIEFWIYPTANMANFTKFITSGVGGGLSIETQSDGNRIHVTNYSTTDYLGSTNALTLNAWTHVAVVRISGTLTIYLNGAFNGSVSNTVNFTQIRYIGGWLAYFTGYLTNIRLIVGTGYYTGPFTGSVPTSPLTTVNNTKLLLLASDSGSILTDSSGVITGITNSSSPATYSVLNPFGVLSGIRAISTASYTSLLLKVASSGTYITDSSTTPNTIANPNTLVYSSLAPLGQGGGFNIAGTGALSFIFASGTSASGGPNTSGQFRKPLQFTYGTPTGFYGYNATGWYLNLGQDINSLSVNSDAAGTWTTNLIVGAGAGVPLITWTHIAMVRNGNELSLFKNGILVAFTAGANDWNFSNPNNIGYIGYYNYYNNGTTSTYLKGYVSNLRIVSGQALYQSSFTPQTAPFENLQISSTGTAAITTASYVQLLTAQSNIIVDNSTNNLSIANTATTPVSVATNATYIYTGYVYETSSTVLLTANFIGTETTVVDHSYNTASITLVNSPTISVLSPFGTILPSNTSTSYQGYLNASNGYLAFTTYDGSNQNFQVSTTALTTGTWNHVAYTYNTLRDYHQLSMYVNGNRIFTTSSFTTLTTTQVVGSPVTQLVLTNNPTTITSSTYIFGATNASDFEFSIGFNGIGLATGYLGMGYINLSTMVYTQAAEWAWYATYNLPIARRLIYYAINPAIASNNFRLHAIKIGNNLTISIDDVNNVAQESETIALLAGTNYKIYVYYIKDTYNDTRTGTIITDTVNAFSAITTSSVSNLTSAIISDSNENFFIGGVLNTSENFNGYMSNLRVVKDAALYLGSFIGVPTSNVGTLTNTVTFPATTAIKTSLLTLQDEYVKDNSKYSSTLVAGGAPKTTVYSPFSTNNLSGYFNGKSVMIFPNTTSLNIAGGPWTIELWLNHPGNYTNYNALFAKRNTSGAADTSYEGYLAITTGYIAFYNGTQYISTTIVPPNVWNHIAYVYDGTAVNIYLNGVCVYSTVATVVDTVSPLTIGAVQYTTAPTYNEYLYGYMSNFRIIKGTALYNSTFNPSQIPLALYSGNPTNLLLNFTDSKAVDYSGNTTIRTNNTTTYTISNLTTKYNQYSLSFNGSSDVLIATSSTSFVYGSNDFTWEMWIYPTSSTWNTSLTYLLDHGGAGAGGSLRYNSDRLSYFNATVATSTASTSLSISTSTWTHIAVARQNAVTSVFINGIFVVSTQTDTYNYTFPSVAVGNLNTSTATPNYFQGYMEDVRLTKGVARYTSQVFVPPIKLSNR